MAATAPLPPPPPSPADGLRELLTAARQARRAEGLRCPRCGSSRIHRWGTFSQRQRYRCRGSCGRTFSDLTRTPFAYAKKAHLAWAFQAGMPYQETLRAAAQRLDIHTSTAFRWRHRILWSEVRRDRETVSGRIELTLIRLAECRKGERNLPRPPRRRELPYGTLMRAPRVPVVFACDDPAHWIGVVVGALPPARDPTSRPSLAPLIYEWPSLEDLERSVGPRIRQSPTTRLLASEPRYSSMGKFVRKLTPRAAGRAAVAADVGEARDRQRRFRQWLLPFMGVASRYLAHYLIWYRRMGDGDAQRRPTVPANTPYRPGKRWHAEACYKPPRPPPLRSPVSP